mmetsp:Transcript_14356/g.23469  ORF Transcript_14356/g.23469 Transcript_14356/m.23469 type:complete len:200 (+) Transcript_14356:125-724(+)
MLRQRAHEDEFLQDIEDASVHRCKNTLRMERFFVKDAMGQVNMLQDPSLHDLLIMHNRSIRARSGSVASDSTSRRNHRSSSASTAPETSNRRRRQVQDTRNPKAKRKATSGKGQTNGHGRDLSAIEQVKGLCQQLDGSIQHHCVSFGVPEDLGLHRVQRSSIRISTLQESLRGLLQKQKHEYAEDGSLRDPVDNYFGLP